MQNLPSGRFFCGPDGMFLVFRESWGVDRLGPAGPCGVPTGASFPSESFKKLRRCESRERALLIVFVISCNHGSLYKNRKMLYIYSCRKKENKKGTFFVPPASYYTEEQSFEAAPKEEEVYSMKRICMILALLFVFALPVFAPAEGTAGRPSVSMILPEEPVVSGETIPVEIIITNTSAVDYTEPMSLFGPDGKKIKSFGAPVLGVGEKHTWQGTWVVNAKQLKDGKLSYTLGYSIPDENGEMVKKRLRFRKSITIAEPGQETAKTDTNAPKRARQEVVPLAVDPEKADLNNGSYCIGFRNPDKIREEGYLTMDLYVQEHFDAQQIRSLAPGDTIRVDGSVWTVKEMVIHSDSNYELYPVEELWGYIAFWLQDDGTFLGVRDDWSPVIYVGEKTVKVPLKENFAFYTYSAGELEEPKDYQSMLDALESNGDQYVPYNTNGVFENGELVKVTHSSYPEGPDWK